jgi:hypothetical protein
VPADEAAVFEELLTQAVPDPVNGHGCDFRDQPTDHQPLRQVRDGTVRYWPRAISNGPEEPKPGAVFAHVTIREIVVPAISAGPGDDLLDIDLRWRQRRPRRSATAWTTSNDVAGTRPMGWRGKTDRLASA